MPVIANYPYSPGADAQEQADEQLRDWNPMEGTEGLQEIVDWLPIAALGPFLRGNLHLINLGLTMLEQGIWWKGDGCGGAVCRLPHRLRRPTDMVTPSGVIQVDKRVEHRVALLAAERVQPYEQAWEQSFHSFQDDQ